MRAGNCRRGINGAESRAGARSYRNFAGNTRRTGAGSRLVEQDNNLAAALAPRFELHGDMPGGSKAMNASANDKLSRGRRKRRHVALL
jgi:hypothetical protein